MEKVKQTAIMSYPMLRLYKSDLEGLYNLFRTNYEVIEIIADGYKLNDLSELSKLNKQEIIDFQISADNPYISVAFSNNSARVYLSDGDNIKLRGLSAQIDDLLADRKSILRFFSSYWLQVPLTLLFWLLIWFFPFKQYKTQGLALLLLLLLFYVLWVFWAYQTDTRKHVLIYLSDQPTSFVKRNKDKMIIAVLSVLMGGIMTLIVNLLLKII